MISEAEDIVLFVVKYGYTKTSIAYVQKVLDELRAAENTKVTTEDNK